MTAPRWLCSTALLLLPATIAAQNSYTIRSIPPVPGPFNLGVALNDAGEVVGTSSSDGYLWTAAGGVQPLPRYPGGTMSSAEGISPSGDIVGYADSPSGSNATIWAPLSGGGFQMVNLGTAPGDLQSVALGMNGSANVCGNSDTGFLTRAVVWELIGNPYQYQLTVLPPLPGDTDANAFDINASDVMVGFSSTPLLTNAVRWTRSNSSWTVTDLGSLGSGFKACASGINNNGTIAGTSVSPATFLEHVVVWTPSIVDLGTLGSNSSYANAINDAGEIVGDAFDSSAGRWTAIYTSLGSDAGIIDLNAELPPATPWVLNFAEDINNHGQIVGEGTISGVGLYAFVLTPIVSKLTGPTPGLAGQVNTLVAENATPGNFVSFFVDLNGGETLLPGCLESLDLAAPILLGNAVANAAGRATLNVFVPGSASQQTFLFQSVDAAACLVSNVNQVTFP